VADRQRRIGFCSADTTFIRQCAAGFAVQTGSRSSASSGWELIRARTGSAHDDEWTRFEMPMSWSVKEGLADEMARHDADARQNCSIAGRSPGQRRRKRPTRPDKGLFITTLRRSVPLARCDHLRALVASSQA